MCIRRHEFLYTFHEHRNVYSWTETKRKENKRIDVSKCLLIRICSKCLSIRNDTTHILQCVCIYNSTYVLFVSVGLKRFISWFPSILCLKQTKAMTSNEIYVLQMFFSIYFVVLSNFFGSICCVHFNLSFFHGNLHLSNVKLNNGITNASRKNRRQLCCSQNELHTFVGSFWTLTEWIEL